MEKYVIVKIVRGGEIQEDVHDLMLGAARKRANMLRDYLGEWNVKVFFSEVCNQIIPSSDFAEIETNFHLNDEQKVKIVELTNYWFLDGERLRRTLRCRVNAHAVKFSEVKDELIYVEENSAAYDFLEAE